MQPSAVQDYNKLLGNDIKIFWHVNICQYEGNNNLFYTNTLIIDDNQTRN